MLFSIACVIDSKYNLKGTKHVIRTSSNAFNCDAPITYSNFENTLRECI